jgi:hypothetical protein
MAALPHGESLTLFPSEESKERKWAIVFSVSTELIGAPRDLREPLERSFDVPKQFFRLRIALFFGVAAYLFGSLYVQFHRTRQHAFTLSCPIDRATSFGGHAAQTRCCDDHLPRQAHCDRRHAPSSLALCLPAAALSFHHP